MMYGTKPGNNQSLTATFTGMQRPGDPGSQKTTKPPEIKAVWNPGLRFYHCTTRPLYSTAPSYPIHPNQRHTCESTYRLWSNTMLHDSQIPNSTLHSLLKKGTGMGNDYHRWQTNY